MKNVQLHPTRKIVATNELIGKRFFIVKPDAYARHLNFNTGLFVTDKKRFKGERELHSNLFYGFDPQVIAKDPAITESPNQFDFVVLTVCVSEWAAGNRYLTYSTIYRALTGKVGESDANPSRIQLARIKASLKKLMNLNVIMDLTEICENLGYNGGKPLQIKDKIVPAKFVKCTVNGQKTTVIELLAESPFSIAAKVKRNQFVSFDAALLNVPRQNNSPMNITIKHYVMRRLLEIKGHARQMTPSITFADIYEKFKINKADHKKKHRIRELMKTFFEHLVDNDFLASFQVNKKNGGFYSISVTFADAKNKEPKKTKRDKPKSKAPQKVETSNQTERIVYQYSFDTQEIVPSIHWKFSPLTHKIVPPYLDISALRYIFKTPNFS